MIRRTFFRTIAFKLTLWFTGIFSVCSGVAFILFYAFSVQTVENQVDRELLDDAAKFITVIRRSGLAGARELAVIEAQAAGEKQIFFRLLYPSGEVFASSHMAYWQQVHISTPALKKMIKDRTNVFETLSIPESRQRVRILYSYVANNVILQTGIAMDSADRFLSAFRKVFLGVMGFILVFSAVSGWILVQKSLAGVKSMTRTALDISGSNLDTRVVGTGRKDELDLLADAFNNMLDRIEALVKSIREMSDNIAHDLKSPITRLRGAAEIALIHDEGITSYQAMASDIIEESDRLLDMINTMLLISRADAGEENFQYAHEDISVMVTRACELFLPLAEDNLIALSQQVEPGLKANADIRMLQRAFSNLLDNAIKYTPENGEISVSASRQGTDICIRVLDNGPGIDSGHLEKIFERFYRVESSRTTPGTGLGLSLARTIMKQHKGDVKVSSRQGAGSAFELILPIDNFEIIPSSH